MWSEKWGPLYSQKINFISSCRNLTIEWKLWRIIHDDIRDLESVKDISKIKLLAELLPTRVGSPLSVNNLAKELEINQRTAASWISILEKVYCAPKIKAVKKEQKLYLWDWSQIEIAGIRIENLVAGQLLKYCYCYENTQGEKMELRFLRDKDKREVGLVVMKNNRPIFAVECKTGEKNVSPHIRYFLERTPIPFFYQVHLGHADYAPDAKVRVLPLITFCNELGMI